MISMKVPTTNPEIRRLHRIAQDRNTSGVRRLRAVLALKMAGWPEPTRPSVAEYNAALDTILDYFGGSQ